MRPLLLAPVLLALSGTAMGAPLRDVGISYSDVCAVDGKGAISCNTAAKIPVGAPAARSIALGFVLVILDEKGKVLVWNDGLEKRVDLELSFVAKQIGFIGADLCAFGTKGELACGEPRPEKMTLRKAPAKVRFVSAVFSSNSIYLLDDKRNLWCEGGAACARMKHAVEQLGDLGFDDIAWRRAFPGPLDKIADVGRSKIASNVTRVVAGGDICIERPKQPLVCWDYMFGPRTHDFGAYQELVTIGGQACRRNGDTITCTFIDSRLQDMYPDHKPKVVVSTTLTVKGASKLYADTDKLCVEDKAGAVSCTEPVGNQTVPPFEAVTWAKR